MGKKLYKFEHKEIKNLPKINVWLTRTFLMNNNPCSRLTILVIIYCISFVIILLNNREISMQNGIFMQIRPLFSLMCLGSFSDAASYISHQETDTFTNGLFHFVSGELPFSDDLPLAGKGVLRWADHPSDRPSPLGWCITCDARSLS